VTNISVILVFIDIVHIYSVANVCMLTNMICWN